MAWLDAAPLLNYIRLPMTPAMRLFLYLLALMSGLSFAEVANAARPSPVAVGSAVSLPCPTVSATGKRATRAIPLALITDPASLLPEPILLGQRETRPAPAPVQRCDRRRE